ncbi:hypothetical protein J23TS9_42550 [Paenibacillus sp. J23TS9]|uniref:hypothetical protein n=1 Tax=Paenibacillus sp. J23TS9 TaxID=2807193 RepID=UPI001B212781|nr:hypothetical protein [Paenibacillus sp. J23TS9]GIP29125.1 hypothetical protein J23TS9_42550 [Paenibacillus sp. J23TS9]
MDLSTWLSIIGIIITCVGLFVTVNKTKTIHKNSHNSNITNSFNTTKNIDKRKTTYEHHEHHEHHHHTTKHPTSVTSAANSENDEMGKAIALGFGALAVFGVAIFFYIKYKSMIIEISTGVMIVGLLTACLVAYFKESISNGYKYYLLIFWLFVFGMVILINHPIYSPDKLDIAVNKFTSIEVKDAPKTLWQLHKDNRSAALFLTFQIVGLVMMICYQLFYFFLIFKIIANKRIQSINSLIKTDVVFVLIIMLFISGELNRLIQLLPAATN